VSVEWKRVMSWHDGAGVNVSFKLEQTRSGPVHVPGARVAIPKHAPPVEVAHMEFGDLEPTYAGEQPRRVFYWVPEKVEDGEPYRHGPFTDLEEAKAHALEHFKAKEVEEALVRAASPGPICPKCLQPYVWIRTNSTIRCGCKT